LPLEVARDARLAEARASAARIIDEADTEVGERLEAARRTATEILDRARSQGEAEGRLVSSREEARRTALERSRVLVARGGLYEELGRRARSAVLELRHEPGYADLLARLEAAARDDLGDRVELEVDPPDAGGVRARAGTLLVDYTLPTLAAACLESLGPRVRRLWE
jgi:vacuolar-type H+-ATPase subunit E/Vma4